MIAAIGAQWLALRRRPMLKVLAGIYAALMLLQFMAPVGILRLLPQLNTLGGTAVINADAVRALEQSVQLPSAFATLFGQINGIGGLLLMVLSGAFVGSDYDWQTARTILSHAPRRGRYLTAKLGALALLAAILVIVSVPLGLGLAALASVILGLPITITGADWLAAGRGILIAWVGLLPYIALAAMWATLGRSAAAGIAGSIGYWLLEVGLGVLSIFEVLGTLGERIYNFSLAQSVGAWTDITRRAFNLDLGRSFGQFGFGFPSLAQAGLMLVLYSGVFIGVAWWALRRRDVRF